ncbi:MAG TPA: hypothetical protein VGN72_23060 [Tepidisphaeraceae bacterium]|jgi:urea transporter|nr:hypothetical protein [Tepidisphaeraceae bacterium]
MRQFIPSVREIIIFAVLSITMAIVVSSFMNAASHDLGLSFLAMPLFVFSAILGLRRNWARNAAETDSTSA